MARVNTIFPVIGSIGAATFTERHEQTFVKRKSSLTGDRWRNDPDFLRSRENSSNFGGATMAAGNIWKALKSAKLTHLSAPYGHNFLAAKLFKALMAPSPTSVPRKRPRLGIEHVAAALPGLSLNQPHAFADHLHVALHVPLNHNLYGPSLPDHEPLKPYAVLHGLKPMADAMRTAAPDFAPPTHTASGKPLRGKKSKSRKKPAPGTIERARMDGLVKTPTKNRPLNPYATHPAAILAQATTHPAYPPRHATAPALPEPTRPRALAFRLHLVYVPFTELRYDRDTRRLEKVRLKSPFSPDIIKSPNHDAAVKSISTEWLPAIGIPEGELRLALPFAKAQVGLPSDGAWFVAIEWREYTGRRFRNRPDLATLLCIGVHIDNSGQTRISYSRRQPGRPIGRLLSPGQGRFAANRRGPHRLTKEDRLARAMKKVATALAALSPPE